MNQFWHLHYSIEQPLHFVVVALITLFLAFGLLFTTAVLSEKSDAGVKHAQHTLLSTSEPRKA
ncbi:hypothetical protein [Marinagarivorans cellulosilyticus]|uniref:hypothetical protein n=1 Tax=Marinagarivorans cellulosilyticus TaxID=2721545 RepID=UPI001F453A0C|nr:hypothetical protein [Marinagarivorans cellulosilyticus]